MKKSVDEILLEFNNKIKLSEFLKQYIELTPRGNSFVACCPFHKEKTPSFSVSDDKGLFYCFGCGVGGNAITFVSKYKNLSFRDSLSLIASNIGISIDLKNYNKNIDLQNKRFELLNFANDIFKSYLLRNSSALDYLKKRFINEKIIEKFSIGYCPSFEFNLKDELLKKGFSDQDIDESGLVIKSQKKNNIFSRFNDRITFPIYDFADRIVGFGGRTISNSKIKYINSPENILYKKSHNLYGLKQNIEEIKNEKEIIIVEGYLDVISLYANNLQTVVATLGTTLSEKQILKIWSYTNNPIICFDGDEAGLRAMHSVSLKILSYLKPGKSVKFMILPDNLDPDNFVVLNGKKSFNEIKKKSINLSDFIWQKLIESEKNLTPEYSALLDEKIKQISRKINDSNVSNEYLKFLRNKKNNYLWENRRYSKNTENLLKKSEFKDNKNISRYTNEFLLMSYSVFEPEITNDFIEEIVKIKFENKELNNQKDFIINKIISSDQKLKFSDFLNFLETKFTGLFEKLLVIKNNHFKNLEISQKNELLKNIISNLRIPKLLNERELIKSKIIEKPEENELKRLIKQHERITNEINSIKKREI